MAGWRKLLKLKSDLLLCEVNKENGGVMRCPKCSYISFDQVENCARCGKDVSELSQTLNGAIFNAVAPNYLAPVEGEESYYQEIAENVEHEEIVLGEVDEEEGLEIDFDETAEEEVVFASSASEAVESLDQEPDIDLDMFADESTGDDELEEIFSGKNIEDEEISDIHFDEDHEEIDFTSSLDKEVGESEDREIEIDLDLFADDSADSPVFTSSEEEDGEIDFHFGDDESEDKDKDVSSDSKIYDLELDLGDLDLDEK